MTEYTVSLAEPVVQRHTYEDKQYASCHITRDATGFAITADFSNGKKLDGDHFLCLAILKAEDGQTVAAASFKCGIDATLFGGTNTKEFNSHIDLTDEDQTRAVHALIVFEQPNQRDDVAIWKAIAEVAKKVYEVFFANKPDAPTPGGVRKD